MLVRFKSIILVFCYYRNMVQKVTVLAPVIIVYDLDLIWFNKEGSIVYMVEGASPCKNTLDAANCTYKNTKPAKYVLAATSGFAYKHKITEKSKMDIISI